MKSFNFLARRTRPDAPPMLLSWLAVAALLAFVLVVLVPRAAWIYFRRGQGAAINFCAGCLRRWDETKAADDAPEDRR